MTRATTASLARGESGLISPAWSAPGAHRAAHPSHLIHDGSERQAAAAGSGKRPEFVAAQVQMNYFVRSFEQALSR